MEKQCLVESWLGWKLGLSERCFLSRVDADADADLGAPRVLAGLRGNFADWNMCEEQMDGVHVRNGSILSCSRVRPSKLYCSFIASTPVPPPRSNCMW